MKKEKPQYRPPSSSPFALYISHSFPPNYPQWSPNHDQSISIIQSYNPLLHRLQEAPSLFFHPLLLIIPTSTKRKEKEKASISPQFPSYLIYKSISSRFPLYKRKKTSFNLSYFLEPPPHSHEEAITLKHHLYISAIQRPSIPPRFHYPPKNDGEIPLGPFYPAFRRSGI